MQNNQPKKEKYGLWARLKRFVRLLYLKVLRIQATPHNIAIGLAAGVFIGLLPTLPIQTILAVTLAFILRGSKIAAALGTWVSNPLNWALCYYLFYKVGSALAPFDVPPFKEVEFCIPAMVELGWTFFGAMMIGALVIATPSAILAYFLSKRFVKKYQERKAVRRLQKAMEEKESADTNGQTPERPEGAEISDGEV